MDTDNKDGGHRRGREWRGDEEGKGGQIHGDRGDQTLRGEGS